jgi:hypothetical protein
MASSGKDIWQKSPKFVKNQGWVEKSGIMRLTNFVCRWRRYSQMNKNKLQRDFVRLPASRLRGVATAVSCVAANLPPNFVKTTISLAFPQIRRQNPEQ